MNITDFYRSTTTILHLLSESVIMKTSSQMVDFRFQPEHES